MICISFHYGHVLGKCWMCKNGYFWKDVIFQQILITLSWNWQSHIVFSHYGPHEVFWYLNVGLAAPTYFLSTITSPRGWQFMNGSLNFKWLYFFPLCWQFMNFGSLNVTSNDCISFHYVGNSWILDHSMIVFLSIMLAIHEFWIMLHHDCISFHYIHEFWII